MPKIYRDFILLGILCVGIVVYSFWRLSADPAHRAKLAQLHAQVQPGDSLEQARALVAKADPKGLQVIEVDESNKKGGLVVSPDPLGYGDSWILHLETGADRKVIQSVKIRYLDGYEFQPKDAPADKSAPGA
jgi:hypothetical protein